MFGKRKSNGKKNCQATTCGRTCIDEVKVCRIDNPQALKNIKEKASELKNKIGSFFKTPFSQQKENKWDSGVKKEAEKSKKLARKIKRIEWYANNGYTKPLSITSEKYNNRLRGALVNNLTAIGDRARGEQLDKRIKETTVITPAQMGIYRINYNPTKAGLERIAERAEKEAKRAERRERAEREASAIKAKRVARRVAPKTQSVTQSVTPKTQSVTPKTQSVTQSVTEVAPKTVRVRRDTKAINRIGSRVVRDIQRSQVDKNVEDAFKNRDKERVDKAEKIIQGLSSTEPKTQTVSEVAPKTVRVRRDTKKIAKVGERVIREMQKSQVDRDVNTAFKQRDKARAEKIIKEL